MFSLIDQYLGTGTAGTCVSHGPEILTGWQGQDSLSWQVFVPLLQCFLVHAQPHFLVAFVHRGVELIFRKVQVVGEKFPAKTDGLLLKVVAKGEIAQHLEKGMVPGSTAHVTQIIVLAPGSHALLAGGGPDIISFLLT